MLPRAHPSADSNGISIGSAVLHSSSQNVVGHVGGMTFFLKIALSHDGSGPPSNTWFLGSIRRNDPNDISISSAVCAQFTVDSPYTLQWAPLPPKCPSHGGSGPHLI